MALQSRSMFALAMLLPVTLASPALNPSPIGAAVPARRDGTGQFRIHPTGDSTLCLCAYFPGPGINVFLNPCGEDTEGYTDVWRLETGDNLSVSITGIGPTQFCLDAGSTPANNGLVRLGNCSPGVQQQHWYYTDDQHLAITGGNQCLDSGGPGAAQVQTYQCTGGNTNQEWDLEPVQ